STPLTGTTTSMRPRAGERLTLLPPTAPPSFPRRKRGASTRTSWRKSPTPCGVKSGGTGRSCGGGRPAPRRVRGVRKRRIKSWERLGCDHSTFPGLDATARAVAGAYPELLLGPGYRGEDGVDDTDYGAALWDAMCIHDDKPPPRHSTRRLADAAEVLSRSGG